MSEESFRKEKLERLREMKVNPFPYSFPRTHTAQKIKENFPMLTEWKEEVKVSGRIITRREHGKTTFCHIRDGSGDIQIYLRQDILKEKYDFLSFLDIGDFIGVIGEVFKTKTGEITILVKDFSLLAKSLRPLPDKWHGLRDIEKRYRLRHLDLLVNPEVKEIFVKRMKIINLIRNFLLEKGFIEVETPILQPIYGGAFAQPFQTYYSALEQEMFLRISDELYLKRLIIGGFEKVFEIGPDFRNEGIDRFHNPEFTQIEIYEAYRDYKDFMGLTEEIFRHIATNLYGTTRINYQGTEIDFALPFHRISFVPALAKKLGKDPLSLPMAELIKIAKDLEIEVGERITQAKILDKLFSTLVQSEIKEPTFVYDHPRITTPLAKVHRENPELVERFEPIICGIEVGNAFSEENDPVRERERFLELIRQKEEFCVLDEDFLTALEYGMPPTAGLGLGIDRIVMLFTNSSSIRDVILFPQLREKKD
jgi:lysyl-tRNA synthetase class 2|uniref:Lysine--tRNA ligase n=1 Tax=candidate division WOR-3 bacterium TaxID=2052148 RepID=A0A7C3UZH2_UNCW3